MRRHSALMSSVGRRIETASAGNKTQRAYRPGEMLKCLCWCQASTTTVPAEDVRNGLTLPCFGDWCQAEDRRQRGLGETVT